MEGLREVMRIFFPFFNITTCLIIAFDTSFLRVSGSAITDIRFEDGNSVWTRTQTNVFAFCNL